LPTISWATHNLSQKCVHFGGKGTIPLSILSLLDVHPIAMLYTAVGHSSTARSLLPAPSIATERFLREGLFRTKTVAIEYYHCKSAPMFATLGGKIRPIPSRPP